MKEVIHLQLTIALLKFAAHNGIYLQPQEIQMYTYVLGIKLWRTFHTIYLNNYVVNVVTKEEYLGVFIAYDNSGDEDVCRQMRAKHARA